MPQLVHMDAQRNGQDRDRLVFSSIFSQSGVVSLGSAPIVCRYLKSSSSSSFPSFPSFLSSSLSLSFFSIFTISVNLHISSIVFFFTFVPIASFHILLIIKGLAYSPFRRLKYSPPLQRPFIKADCARNLLLSLGANS